MPNIVADSTTSASAVDATNSGDGRAVQGVTSKGQAVYGESREQVGVVGVSGQFVGVWGESRGNHPGVFGKSKDWQGVHGESVSQAGVAGYSDVFVGVWGESHGNQPGVLGRCQEWQGVHGESVNQAGVAGYSTNFAGVWAETKAASHPAIVAKGRNAALLDGGVQVNGTLRVGGLDVAAVVSDLASRLATLEGRVKQLESRAGVTGGSGTPSAFMKVLIDPTPLSVPGVRNYTLSGGGFPPNSAISLRIARASVVIDQPGGLVSDSWGWFEYKASLNCDGQTYQFSAAAGSKTASTDVSCN